MTESAQPLPKTRTVSLCRQWKRCGRPGCRCAAGELHGPYWYLFWREAGRLRKRYVRQADVAAIREDLERHRQGIELQRLARRMSRQVWREQIGELREYERWLRQPT